MGSFNILVAEDRLSLADSRKYKLTALFKGYARAIEKKIGDASELAMVSDRMVPVEKRQFPKSVDVRESAVTADFGTAVDAWQTAALAVVGNPYSCFQGAIGAAAPILLANQLLVIYGVSIETTPMPVSRLQFRNQTNVGNIIAQFDLEQLIPYDHWFGFFSEPVVVDPSRGISALVQCRIATGVAGLVRLATYMFEPAGTTMA